MRFINKGEAFEAFDSRAASTKMTDGELSTMDNKGRPEGYVTFTLELFDDCCLVKLVGLQHLNFTFLPTNASSNMLGLTLPNSYRFSQSANQRRHQFTLGRARVASTGTRRDCATLSVWFEGIAFAATSLGGVWGQLLRREVRRNGDILAQ